MEKTPFVVLLFLAITALFALNPGIRKASQQGGCEISIYQYSQLHAAMERYPEIADMALDELSGERVTLSQYNRVMQTVHVIRLKEARGMTAHNDRFLPVRTLAKN
ncbi:hypothetical protein KOM00_09185 [Geomonas sp. Red69]|uniref:Uncharacterized protein n=1 Tax=Geomonas diazotrophica TaxID=2843197 RepID=A0ABX8JM13_9BACT|nr:MULTISPECIES: hypothetical protein [Geomonas]MBU5636908.1 hypothetical protein [Geomonas diazotrophica]QWV98803.1 hypothetical protein KP005_05820 [Geomonas nitrogeniifigens]QXE87959.1 hypothetical protein KP003_06025 [Geomonas nitrogeniifigens]